MIKKNIPKKRTMQPSRYISYLSSQEESKYKEEHICRICGNEGNISIFHDTTERNIIIDITSCANVKINKNDGLPNHICSPCLGLLDSALLFKQKCEKMDLHLRAKYEQSIKVIMNEGNQNTDADNVGHESSYIKNKSFGIDCSWPVNDDDVSSNKTNQRNEHEVERHLINCLHCGMCFIDNEEYNIHLPGCILYRDKRSGAKPQSIPEKTPLLCEFCGRGFMKLICLRAHSLVHSDKLPFECDHCPYGGRNKNSVKRHMLVHTGEKPFKCDKCDKTFINTSNLRKHSWQHDDKKPKLYKIQCSICHKGFPTMRHKTDHVQFVHFGVKAYDCDVCGTSLSTRKTLRNHGLKAHNIKVSWTGRPPVYVMLEQREKAKLMEIDESNVEFKNELQLYKYRLV